jgi:hypothetical protein
MIKNFIRRHGLLVVLKLNLPPSMKFMNKNESNVNNKNENKNVNANNVVIKIVVPQSVVRIVVIINNNITMDVEVEGVE